MTVLITLLFHLLKEFCKWNNFDLNNVKILNYDLSVFYSVKDNIIYITNILYTDLIGMAILMRTII